METSCIKIEKLKGHNAKAWDSYAFIEDGFSQLVHVVNDDQGVQVLDSDLPCLTTSPASLLCTFAEGDKSTVETWTFDFDAGKAVYTKPIIGYGELDGVSAMVGELAARD